MLAVILVLAASTPVTLRGRKLSFSQKKRLLAVDNPTDGWYFVRFHDDIPEETLRSQGISVESTNIIMRRTYGLFLTRSQISFLAPLADLQRIENHHRLIASQTPQNDIVELIVEVTPDFLPPANTTLNWKRMSNTVFLVTFSDYGKALQEILPNSRVFAVTPAKPGEHRNIMGAGWTHSNDISHAPKLDSATKFLFYPRSLEDHGLNGTGVIVTLMDSFLDANLTWFWDPQFPSHPTETINPAHRKVVYYKMLDDMSEGTKYIAHGTHVATILAGTALSGDHNAELHNGVATGAKLAWIDQPRRGPIALGTMVLDTMNKVNSKITSCSWGDGAFTGTTHEFFDKISFENPDKLFIIADANSAARDGYHSYNSLSSPESCKNVLSIGSLAQIPVSSESRSKTGRNRYLLIFVVDSFPSTYARRLEWSGSVDKYFEADDNVIWKQTDSLFEMDYEGKCIFARNMTTIAKQIDFKKVSPACCIVEEDDGWTPTSSTTVPPVFVVEDPESWRQTVTVSPSVVQIMQEYRVVENGTAPGIASYSSRGPSIHGLMKPDVVAPGSGIASGASRAKTEAGSSLLAYMSGCSMATPNVAGAIAILQQYFEQGHHMNKSITPSGHLLKAVLVSCCDRPVKSVEGKFSMDGELDVDYGHGWPNLGANLPLPTNKRKMIIADNLEVSGTLHLVGEFSVTDCNDSLRVTLDYLDDPLSADSPIGLYNHLTLLLELPDGTILIGNGRADQTEDRYSTTQRVLIDGGCASYVPGTYKLHILAKTRGKTPVKYSLCIIGGVKETELELQTTLACVGKTSLGECDNKTGHWECSDLATGPTCNRTYNDSQIISVEGGYHTTQILPYGVGWVQFQPPTETPWDNLSFFVVSTDGYQMLSHFKRGRKISTDPWDYDTILWTPSPHQFVIACDSVSQFDTFTVMIKNNGPVLVTYSLWYRINYTGPVPPVPTQSPDGRHSRLTKILAVVFGVLFSIAFVCLICMIVIVYKRKKRYEASSTVRSNLLQVV